MKALLISGSPRAQGNTVLLLNRCLAGLQERGIDGETVSLAGKQLAGCRACGACKNTGRCALGDDFAPLYEQMLAADIIVVGSPVYFGSATPEMMALLQRAGCVARPKNLFKHKIGGPLAVARRAGKNFTYAELMFWYTINHMIVVGSSYWNVSLALGAGEAANDAEALQTVDDFAENLAWLARKIHG
ncbi:FMN reductase [Planctomycetales bacterium]|nr:FMN reductase [Planctomycetales bacterium]